MVAREKKWDEMALRWEEMKAEMEVGGRREHSERGDYDCDSGAWNWVHPLQHTEIEERKEKSRENGRVTKEKVKITATS